MAIKNLFSKFINKRSSNNDYHEEREPKRGHIFCGFCCDTRRAVIIVDALNIIMLLTLFVGYVFQTIIMFQEEGQQQSSNYQQEDQEEEEYNDEYYYDGDGNGNGGSSSSSSSSSTAATKSFHFGNITNEQWIVIGSILLAITCCGIGIFGAIKYNPTCTLITSCWFAAQIFLSMVELNPIGILLSSYFAYPHIIFLLEMKKGIMTKEYYDTREKYSICCV